MQCRKGSDNVEGPDNGLEVTEAAAGFALPGGNK